MNEADIVEYLSRLLNRAVTSDMPLSLTSGQRARFLGWIERSGSSVDDLRGVLARSFSVRQLLSQPDPAADQAVGSRDSTSTIAPGANASSSGGFAGVGIDIQRVAEILPYD